MRLIQHEHTVVKVGVALQPLKPVTCHCKALPGVVSIEMWLDMLSPLDNGRIHTLHDGGELPGLEAIPLHNSLSSRALVQAITHSECTLPAVPLETLLHSLTTLTDTVHGDPCLQPGAPRAWLISMHRPASCQVLAVCMHVVPDKAAGLAEFFIFLLKQFARMTVLVGVGSAFGGLKQLHRPGTHFLLVARPVHVHHTCTPCM